MPGRLSSALFGRYRTCAGRMSRRPGGPALACMRYVVLWRQSPKGWNWNLEDLERWKRVDENVDGRCETCFFHFDGEVGREEGVIEVGVGNGDRLEWIAWWKHLKTWTAKYLYIYLKLGVLITDLSLKLSCSVSEFGSSVCYHRYQKHKVPSGRLNNMQREEKEHGR